MKIAILAMMLSFLCGSAFAGSLEFEWGYPAEAQAQIVGFRLYRDGTILEPVSIAATDRTATVPRQTDKRSHTYHLTAYSAEDESGPSATAIDAYVAAKVEPITGTLTIKVIP